MGLRTRMGKEYSQPSETRTYFSSADHQNTRSQKESSFFRRLTRQFSFSPGNYIKNSLKT